MSAVASARRTLLPEIVASQRIREVRDRTSRPPAARRLQNVLAT
jgi:hypothetical protein